jgi:hypothetical protein
VTKPLCTFVAIAVVTLALTSTAWAQDKATASEKPSTPPVAKAAASAASAQKPLVPLKLQIVVSKYKGEKKISSIPYMVSVNSNGPQTRMRAGSDVPVPLPNGGVNYRNVGTDIDSSAISLDDGRFEVTLSVSDSSIYMNDPIAGIPGPETAPAYRNAAPAYRNFSTTNTTVLKDGQTVEMAAATDAVSGEVLRVDVTLTVTK